MHDIVFDYDGALELARQLYATATWLDTSREERRVAADDALKDWTGPYGEDFAAQADQEETETGSVYGALVAEAHDWAQAWTDAMNDQNRRNRDRKVEELSATRWSGEQLVDLFVGDDSDEVVPDLVIFTRPTAPDFLPTGQLQLF